MWAMSYEPPQTLDDLLHVPGLGPWRRNTYGSELLQVVANARVELPDEATDEPNIESAENTENISEN